jgi:hypothetical protein
MEKPWEIKARAAREDWNQCLPNRRRPDRGSKIERTNPAAKAKANVNETAGEIIDGDERR